MKTQTRPFPHPLLGRALRPACSVLLGAATLGSSLHAGDHKWSGAVSSLWSVDGNWSVGGAPKLGEANVNLLFPQGGNPTTVQNIVGLEVDTLSIQGSGYNVGGLNGARLALRGGAGALTIGANHDTLFNNTLGVVLGDPAVEINLGTSTDLYIEGVISGRGGLVKTGPGSLEFAGTAANSFQGVTDVQAGLLRLNKSGVVAVPANLIVGVASGAVDTTVVRLLKAAQIADTSVITFLRTGLLDLNDLNDGAAGLVFNGGHLSTGGNGVFALGGTVTVNPTTSVAFIDGRLSLGNAVRTFNVGKGNSSPALFVSAVVSSAGLQSAGIYKTGDGELRLSGNNTYSGPTTVAAGMLGVQNGHALGQGDAGNILLNPTTVLDGAVLRIDSAVVPDEALILNGAGSGSFGALACAPGTATWQGSIRLASDAVISVDPLGTLYLDTVVTGPGGFSLEGGGILQLTGDAANTYVGTTHVDAGRLELNKIDGLACVPGPLVIGDNAGAGTDQVLLKAHNQIADTSLVTVLQTGVLDAGNFSEAVGGFELTGGQVNSAVGTITLLGDVTVHPDPTHVATITGKLSLGGSTRTFNTVGHSTSPDLLIKAVVSGGGGFFPGVIKVGNGELELAGPNTYAGLTLVNEGTLEVANDQALGGEILGTQVKPGAFLVVFFDTHIGNESLSLDHAALFSRFGNASWAGPVSLTGDCGIEVLQAANTFTLSGVIGGAGGFTKLGQGTLELSGPDSNTYAGATVVGVGTLKLSKFGLQQLATAIPGNLVVGDGTGGADADKVVWTYSHQVADTSDVMVNSSGELLLDSVSETIAALVGSGHISLLFSGLSAGGDNSSTLFSGNISGAEATFHKQGTGTLTFTGTHTLAGEFDVDGGTLIANGDQHFTDILIKPGGTFGGVGTSKNITSTGGVLSPGSSPGVLNAAKVQLDAASTLRIEAAGPNAGSGYDQLHVLNGVALGGAKLEFLPSFDSSVEASFLIVKNDANTPTGLFGNLAEGGILLVNQVKYRITYLGGNGHDVVLTHANTPPSLNTLTLSTPVQEGSAASFAGNIVDPDPLDGFTLSVTWGDGTPAQVVSLAAGTKSFNLSHVYADDNPSGTPSDSYTVHYSLSDPSQASSFGNLNVIVANVAPVVTFGGTDSVAAGTAYVRSGLFADPGTDVWSATVDYGDGTGVHPLTLNPDKTFTVGHTFNTPGSYQVVVVVVDDDLGSTLSTLALTVTQADTPPALRIAPRPGNRVTVSWPAPSTGWVLQAADDLSQPNWTTLPDVPSQNGPDLEVTLLASGPQRFFRLLKP